eukprot:SAG11_NODE_971_length_6351_cov_4.531190_2_plen_167_part_00
MLRLSLWCGVGSCLWCYKAAASAAHRCCTTFTPSISNTRTAADDAHTPAADATAASEAACTMPAAPETGGQRAVDVGALLWAVQRHGWRARFVLLLLFLAQASGAAPTDMAQALPHAALATTLALLCLRARGRRRRGRHLATTVGRIATTLADVILWAELRLGRGD